MNELLEAVESENFKVLEGMLSDGNIVVRESVLRNILIKVKMPKKKEKERKNCKKLLLTDFFSFEN